jgi:DNA-binding NarL/FixJ family response regulator
MDTIKITLVDDDVLIVSLLEKYFNDQDSIEVLSTEYSGEGLLENISSYKVLPDVLVLDLKMKKINGVEVTKILRSNYPDVNIIVMSSHYNKSFMGYMLKAGVAAFVPKGISPEQLVEIVHEVYKNGFFFFKDQLDIVREQVSAKSPSPKIGNEELLSSREIDVLRLICYQKTAKEISEELFISTRTVEGHKNNLFLKTGTKNIAGLVIYAIQNRVINTENIPLI